MLYELKLSDGVIIVAAQLYPQKPAINTVVADPLVLAIRTSENENLIKIFNKL